MEINIPAMHVNMLNIDSVIILQICFSNPVFIIDCLHYYFGCNEIRSVCSDLVVCIWLVCQLP